MAIAMRYGSGDYSRSGGASGGGSGGITMTLLWTNPSPTASFAAQTISLDLSEYDAVVIGVHNFASSDNQYGLIYQFCIKAVSGVDNMLQIVSASNNRNGLRRANVVDTGVWFSACTYNGGTNNGYCIPYQIIGIKGIT